VLGKDLETLLRNTVNDRSIVTAANKGQVFYENQRNSMISNKIDIGSLLFVKSHSLHLMQEDNDGRSNSSFELYNGLSFV
jgi:hypothetical protein